MNTTDKVQVGESTTGTSTSTTWHCPYNAPKAEQGWECPRCGRINAPWKSQCDCSRNNWTITSNWTYEPYRPDWWKDYVYCQQADKVGNTYVNVGGTSSNDTNATSGTTAWNNGPSTQTIHNGKTNAIEEPKKESTPQRIFNKYLKEK